MFSSRLAGIVVVVVVCLFVCLFTFYLLLVCLMSPFYCCLFAVCSRNLMRTSRLAGVVVVCLFVYFLFATCC